MSDSESDTGGLHEWALVEDQEGAQDSEGSNDFVCVKDEKCVSFHHRESVREEDVDTVQDGIPELGEIGAAKSPSLSPTADYELIPWKDSWFWDNHMPDTSSVTDSVTMTAAVAQDEADSITSSCSLEELEIPAQDVLSQSSSSIEELSLPPEYVEDVGVAQGGEVGPRCREDLNGSIQEQAVAQHHLESINWPPFNPERSFLTSVRMRRPSESDTDQSDFVPLDHSQTEDMTGDIMHLSSASSLTNGSSVSSTFRFIHRSDMVLGEEPAKRVYYRDNDEDSVPSDIDDRCESDISGVAGDDSDLSNLTYSLGDVPIAVGNVARSYKHRPNNNLNATLTTIALVALFFVLGIGFGDFIGFHRQAGLRFQQVTKLRSLQDDYLMCLQQQEDNSELIEQQQKENEVIQAVTEEWKEQYDELILERVALETQIDHLQTSMNTDTQAGKQMLSDMHYEAVNLSQLIDELENQDITPTPTDTALVTSDPAAAAGDNADYDTAELIAQQKLAVNVTTQLQQEVDALNKEKDEILFKMDMMRYDVMFEKQTLEALQNAATQKLEKFHQLVMENEDLRKEVGKLRYSEHPGNSVSSHTSATESEETAHHLHLMISKLKNEVDALQKTLASVTENLQRESRAAALWQKRFVEKSYRLDEMLKKSPDLATCLSLIIPAMSFRDLSDIPTDAMRNLSSLVANRIEVIQKLAEDAEFLNTVNAKWEMLRNMLHSPLAEEMKDQSKLAYDEIRKIVADKFESLGGALFENYESEHTNANSRSSREEINTYHNRLHRMVNRTKETVTKLTKKINQTWEKVKDVSGHMTDKVMNGVVPLMQEEVGKWSGKVQHGWDTVKKKVQGGLFMKGRKKKEKRSERKQVMKSGMSEEELKQYHGDPYSNKADNVFDDTFTQTGHHHFEHKPEHKQKTSDIHLDTASQRKFWDKVGFNPDNLLHEGFFEGNERKWRKHQKVLKKLHGRINRLNEDILYDMEDDDIEDLYEDLEDFQDDLEDDVQPMGLKTWLTCQVRWWKSRFQRKHRSEDLLKGCGRQLMHWQIKASCEVKGQRKEKLVSVPACLQYFPHRSVIKTVANDASYNDKNKNHRSKKTTKDYRKKNGKKEKGFEKPTCQKAEQGVEEMDKDKILFRGKNQYEFNNNEDHNISPADDGAVNDTYSDDSASWWFKREQQRENRHVSGHWYWKRKYNHHHADPIPTFHKESWASGVKDTDASWYFMRAEDREFYHHDPRWIFGRAREREYHREKPWYTSRSEKRSERRKQKYN